MTNFYQLLGVNPAASAAEIKTAYRKLAMQYHPDKNPGDKAAEDKFKAITEAYETLSNQNSRAQYDFNLQNGYTNTGFRHTNMNFDGNMDDLLKTMFAQAGFGDFMFRRGPERNKDVNFNLTISLDDVYFGKSFPLNIQTPSGRKIDRIITVPTGIEHGTRIRYQGHGDQQNTSLPPGDLYITILIADHSIFTRSGSNLEMKLQIDALDCITGTNKKVKTIDGSTIDISIPAGIQHSSKLKIAKKGMPISMQANNFGDLFIQIIVKIPTNLDNEDLNKIKEIQQKRTLDIQV